MPKSKKGDTSNRHYNQSTDGKLSSREHIIITVILESSKVKYTTIDKTVFKL